MDLSGTEKKMTEGTNLNDYTHSESTNSATVVEHRVSGLHKIMLPLTFGCANGCYAHTSENALCISMC